MNTFKNTSIFPDDTGLVDYIVKVKTFTFNPVLCDNELRFKTIRETVLNIMRVFKIRIRIL